MAHIAPDRVREFSTSTGTGNFTLTGAVTSFRAFASVAAVNDTFFYTIAGVGLNEWEVGVGTYVSANTIQRTTIIASSNAGSAVNFSAGDKDVFITAPGSKFLQMDNTGSYGNFTAGTITASLSGNAATVTNGLYTTTSFGGDVSGTYNAIVVTDDSHNHSISTISDEYRLFNNMGNNHGTYTDFNSVPNFGAYYLQGGTNGPTGTGADQFYGLYLGLGNDYTSAQYGSQFYWVRQGTGTADKYLWIRDLENGTWGSWRKPYVGKADAWTTARTLTIGNTGKSVDGSGNVSWSLAEIGAQPSGSYLTAESDTLATVTARGATTSTAVTLSSTANHYSGHFYYDSYDAAGNHYPHFNDGPNGTGVTVNWRLYTGASNTTTHTWTPSLATFNSRATINGTGVTNSPTLRINNSSASAFNHAIEAFASDMTAGQTTVMVVGKSGASKESGYLGFNWTSAASDSNYTSLGVWGNDNLLRVYGAGYTEIYNSVRSPILYDLNDTTYFVDPASSSTSARFAGYMGIGGADATTYMSGTSGVSIVHTNYPAVGFANQHRNWLWYVNASNAMTAWTNTNSDTVRIYPTYTEIIGSMRTPIFYDLDDTGYFLNPAGTSHIYNLTVGNWSDNQSYPGIIISGSTSYNYNFLNGSWSGSVTAGFLANCADQWEFAIHDSGERVVSPFLFDGGTGSHRLLMGRDIGWGAMYIEAASSFRAPIFYDSNDTSYYLDPASTGTSLQIAGTIEQGNNYAHPNIEWSASGTSTGEIIFYLPGTTSNYGMVHMVFDIYEYNGNAVSTVIVGGHNWASSWYNTSCNVIGQCGKEVRLGTKDGRFVVVFGTTTSSWEYGQIRLRKIQNGSYYNNIMNLGGDWGVTQTTTESFTNISGDLRQLRTPASFTAGGYVTGSRVWTGYDSGETSSVSASNWFRSSGSTGWYNASYGGGIYMSDGTWVRVYNNKQFYSENYIQSDSSVRAPIFYDSNDTDYYLDPASTSNINRLLTRNGLFAVQGGNNGGSGYGIRLWTYSDSNWGIYMSEAGSGRSMADGSAPASLDGRTSHHVRFRAGTGSQQGFIWETAQSEMTVMSLTTDTGNLHVKGTLYATAKSFQINHPTKPGKKLRYGSLEGPENGVYVRGRLKGKVIELPDYWTKLVDPNSITVQLTPIGKHQKLYVEDIRDNKVYIANDGLFAGEINCFYYVLAERCDVEKLEVEIG